MEENIYVFIKYKMGMNRQRKKYMNNKNKRVTSNKREELLVHTNRWLKIKDNI